MKIQLKTIDLQFDSTRHIYRLKGEIVPGVSSIAGILPKPWLAPYGAKAAIETLEKLVRPNKKYGKEELAQYLALAKAAHTIRRDTALDTGSRVHALLESFIKTGEKIPDQEDTEIQECVNRFMVWVAAHQIEWLASELIIGSERHMYGGTLDAVARLDGKIVLIDFKTSKQISGEYNLQTAGYKIALEELGCPEIEERIIIRLPKDGSEIEIHKIETSFEEDKEAFLAARALYPYIKKIEKMEREKWENSKK